MIGKIKQSCELEIRERAHHGMPRQILQINMGCKQALACENNKAQNFQSENPAWTQDSFPQLNRSAGTVIILSR